MEKNILQIAKNAVQQVGEQVLKLLPYIDSEFEQIIKLCANCKGRIVISGIGKSALIGQKLVATFNSTGTPAIFLHAADAIHGDLGMVQPNDLVLIISKSGNSPEIKVLLPHLAAMGNTTIGMSGNDTGYLAKNATHFLNTTVERESCPNNLAPTTSTAAQLVMGDAMAVTLMEMKGFGKSDFAKYHPGGALGKKLYLKVSDLLEQQRQAPVVAPETNWKEVVVKISEGRMGAVVVIVDGVVSGIVTDGDVRRMLQHHNQLEPLTAQDIMTSNPKTVSPNMLAFEAFQIMESNNITQLVVLHDKGGKFAGLIHLHDIIKEGIY